MKNKITILILCLFCQFCLSQVLTRKTLHGQVINDSIKLENVIVFNVNSKTGMLIGSKGFFNILVKVNDTLVFSSLAFKSRKIILTEKQISAPILRVTLEAYTNQLAEVIVPVKKKIKPINGNTQAIVDKQYFDDEKSSPKNRTMPSDGTIENGMNFVRIYKDVLKTLRKNNPEIIDYTQNKSFTEVALKKVGYDFFANTLQLNDDEIRLFLIFCENDPKSKMLIKAENEFQLIDFLVTKNKKYKKITAIEN
ncbi:hypothetical protein [Flavobacterium urumqiense]|uniref:CarboxypepD_reg-like domain-containing protein n=1 Tax=Flavobacterium urumqiense TaxID=935224 RepID=A0A1H5U249_9FLAO|nr:hypothetical protein [Flavobacterium urumqiense]SEF69212.1 hypothetical protein SAMN04488130_10272 [Flavobacterium urumqiense]